MPCHPVPSPLPTLVFTPQSRHCLFCCRLSPLPREQAPLRVALSSTLSKAHSRQVLQTRWLVQGPSFHMGPAQPRLRVAAQCPLRTSALIIESLHNRFLKSQYRFPDFWRACALESSKPGHPSTVPCEVRGDPLDCTFSQKEK